MDGFIKSDIEAESLQGFGEIARVIGEEGVGEMRGSVGEGCDEQGAIGQGLGTRHTNCGIKGVIDWSDMHKRMKDELPSTCSSGQV